MIIVKTFRERIKKKLIDNMDRVMPYGEFFHGGSASELQRRTLSVHISHIRKDVILDEISIESIPKIGYMATKNV